MSVTEQVKIVHEMMANMSAVDRQLMSDRLLTYLLFDSEKEIKNKTSEAETKNNLEKSGLSVGDMQSKMMEKIEELTLYVIQLKNQNDELKNQVNAGLNK